MFSPDRILTLDVGASKILLGEFSLKGPSAPVLLNYAEAGRDPVAAASENGLSLLAPTVREMMAASGIKPAPLHLMLSGQAVFPRFVKLPGATEDMVDQLVSAEAAESLPFPLDQVVWDYQALGDANGTGELDALIVATKSETAADAAALAEGAGLPLAVVDAAPLALCNAVRANLPEGDESCTLALDIGAKATTLLFVEGPKVFLRTIPVAGNTVTNEIARALGVTAEEAESLKREIAFVALGGTYAVEDDERADRVSKIVRNVATRLHSEIVRSINFYRSQQGGTAPTRVLLTGGTAALRHLDTFFREKLGVEVSLFDPFGAVSLAPALQGREEELLPFAPSTGLALRAAGKAPLEIDLLPSTLAEGRQFRRRIPYFAVAAAGLVAAAVVWNLDAGRRASLREESADAASDRLAKVRSMEKRLSAEESRVKEERERVDWLASVAFSRPSYARALAALRGAMLPGTWLKSLTFDQPSEEGENAGTVRLVVCGFKSELDALAASGASAGERLLSRLGKTDVFAGGSVEREAVLQGDRVSELSLTLSLARPLGTFDAAWVPEVPADGSEEGGPDEPEEGNQP